MFCSVNKELFKTFGLALPITLVTPLCSYSFVELAGKFAFLRDFYADSPALYSSIACILSLGVVSAIYYAYKAAGLVDIEFRPKINYARDEVAFGLQFYFALELVFILVTMAVGLPTIGSGGSVNTQDTVSSWSVLERVIYLIDLCILTPIFEELMVRKYLYQIFRKFGVETAILCTALLFSFLHQDWVKFFCIFPSGIGLGIIREKFGLKYSMLAHGVGNLIPALLGTFLHIGVYVVSIWLAIIIIMASEFISKYLRYSDRLKHAFHNVKWNLAILINPFTLIFIPTSICLGVL